jgi:threonine synthase
MVTDDEILDAIQLLARTEGIFTNLLAGRRSQPREL